MNRLVHAVAEACREHPLTRKLLCAPTRTVGLQWVEQIVRAGQTVINLHVTTLLDVAAELAAPEVARRGLRPLGDGARRVIVEELWTRWRVMANEAAYLAAGVGAHLAGPLAETLHALRLAGVRPSDFTAAAFEVPAKGRELAVLLAAYQNHLEAQKLADDAVVFQFACDRILDDPTALGTDALLLLSADLEPTGLELRLLDLLRTTLPPERRCSLPVDEPGETDGTTPLTDLNRLRWLHDPSAAPPPVQDGTVRIVRAMGEINEVHGVLRHCLEHGIPLEQVEILHTDAETYLPLLYETKQLLRTESDARLHTGVPITFAEGLPALWFQPGRALVAWARWVAGDYQQADLVSLFQQGLLRLPTETPAELDHARLAGCLRELSIGDGRERFATRFARLLARAEGLEITNDDAPSAEEAALNAEEQAALLLLGPIIEPLLALLPPDSPSGAQVLDAAERFLTTFALSTTASEVACRETLRQELRDLRAIAADAPGNAGAAMLARIAAIAQTVRVEARGPQPGHVHVDHVLTGGHSGRQHVFIVGMGDRQFPCSVPADPLLADRERAALSPEIPTAAAQSQSQRRQFQRLLARLRGHLTLTYSCHDLVNDVEQFPSTVLLGICRLSSGQGDADLSFFNKWLGTPLGFLPPSSEACLHDRDWWSLKLDAVETISGNGIQATFPDLVHGLAAARDRQHSRFTPFDGWVPEAALRYQMSGDDDTAWTVSMLETLGRCPLAFFFEHVLGVQGPRTTDAEPDRWLPRTAAGVLLHDIFRQFHTLLAAENRAPQLTADAKRLLELVDLSVARYRDRFPVRNDSVYATEVEELRATALLFLAEEEAYCQTHQPVFHEAVLGLSSHRPGTALDSSEPIRVPLEAGLTLRVRGRIDRVDKVRGQETQFVVWDYKTGGMSRYVTKDLFDDGRHVQHAVYLAAVQARIKEVFGPAAEVERFGYFFPGARGHGERLSWSAAELAEGRLVVRQLLGIAATGGFLASNDEADCTYCAFQACCDLAAVNDASARKLADPTNTVLQPHRELRHVET